MYTEENVQQLEKILWFIRLGKQGQDLCFPLHNLVYISSADSTHLRFLKTLTKQAIKKTADKTITTVFVK